MLAEAAQSLDPNWDRPSSVRGDNLEEDQGVWREPVLFWDEIVKKWPKERFPSFFSVDKNA